MIPRKHKVPPVRRLPSLSGNEASSGSEDETPKRRQPPRAGELHKRKLRKFKVFCCIIQTTHCQILHCGLKYSVHVISASSSSSSSFESEGTGSDSMSDWEKQVIEGKDFQPEVSSPACRVRLNVRLGKAGDC